MKLPLHSAMTNQELGVLFDFIAKVLNMRPGNRYRARAYEEASDVVAHLPYQLHQQIKRLQKAGTIVQAIEKLQRELEALPGIGESIANKLIELLTTGDIRAFQKYVRALPGGMYALMKIHGIGAKKAFALAEKFKLDDPQAAILALLTKAKHGLVQGLTGFGEKSEQQLITTLEGQHHKARIPHAQALKVAEKIEDTLKKSKLVTKVIFLGSLRRGTETVGDIDLGVVAKNPKKVVDYLVKNLSMLDRVLVAGENLLSIIVTNGWQADIKFASLNEWGSFIQHFTGDKLHNIALRELALKKGLSLSEHGIKVKKTGELKKFRTEAEFYKFLGLKLIPPAQRIGGNELEKYLL